MDLTQASFTHTMFSTHCFANKVSEDHGRLKEVLSEACNTVCRSSRIRKAQFRIIGYYASALTYASDSVSEAESDHDLALSESSTQSIRETYGVGKPLFTVNRFDL